jgi:regulatory GntR family protein
VNAHQIAEKIEAQITAGAEGYQHGDRLLSVRDLGEAENVSAQTAAAAYSLLAVRGLVVTSKKSGTRVAATKAASFRLGSFGKPDWNLKDWEVKDGTEEGTVSLYDMVFTTANADHAKLGLPEGSQIVERHYRKEIKGVPVQHKVTILPYDLARSMPQDSSYDGPPPMMTPVGHPVVARPAGKSMMDWLGWDVAHNRVQIQNGPIGEMAAKVLGVPQGTPGLLANAAIRDSEGNVLYLTLSTGLSTNVYILDHEL